MEVGLPDKCLSGGGHSTCPISALIVQLDCFRVTRHPPNRRQALVRLLASATGVTRAYSDAHSPAVLNGKRRRPKRVFACYRHSTFSTLPADSFDYERNVVRLHNMGVMSDGRIQGGWQCRLLQGVNSIAR